MVNAIKHYLPPKVFFDMPNGGLFIWLRLPSSMSATELLQVACKDGVAFVPGKHFFVDDSNGDEWMRLNFVSQSVEDIDEGIKRLGVAIRKLKTRSK